MAKDEIAPFTGFDDTTFEFLRGLSRNNDKAWFEAHRADYQAGYVEAARSFVAALGPRLEVFAPGISAEPRINGSIFRIHRDVRFSKDKTPYKPHLDLWFWQGKHRGAGSPGFFFRLRHDAIIVGAGIHGFDKPGLSRYRDAVAGEDLGPALARLETRLAKAGYPLEGEHYKKVPRGYDADHPRARLLRFNALHAAYSGKVPSEARSKKLVTFVAGHCKRLAPLHGWLLEAMDA